MVRRDCNDDDVYHSRPYHAIYLSDDEEDDDSICVWRDRPELPDFDDSDEDELLSRHFQQKVGINPRGKQKEDRTPRSRAATRPTRVNEELTDTGSSATATTVSPSSSKATLGVSAEEVQEIGKRENNQQQQNVPAPWPRDESGKLTKEAFRERELQYALSTTRRNLTRVMQFMLKLEARAGKTTKEGIRQTLDATVRDKNYDLNKVNVVNNCNAAENGSDAIVGAGDSVEGLYYYGDHKEEIEELKEMSSALYTRMYLLDRTWRRKAKSASSVSKSGDDKKEQQQQQQQQQQKARSMPPIHILSEPAMKEWVKVEQRTNHLSLEDPSFYSVRDLASGRGFGDWMGYLRGICKFRDHPVDENKLVELAWLFLDREIRPMEKPVNPTTGKQFVALLEERRRAGVWKKQLENPLKQVGDDAAAWKTLRRYWSCRTAPA